MISRALQILADVFGYHRFRGLQEQVISAALAGQNALVLMPTGAGKSICYQLPALMMEGTVLVVSPLIALMQDQVAALQQLNISAAFLNSSLDFSRAQSIETQLKNGELDLLYVSPERLANLHFQRLLAASKIAMFAIDEAHCVSQWGHDFRPEYQRLSLLAKNFAHIPRMALTATADMPTRLDIINNLQLENAAQFISSFDRPNIHYTIGRKTNPNKQLIDFIKEKHQGDSGIVYCMSRKKVDMSCAFLLSQNIKALSYHAGMSSSQRHSNLQRFLREEGVVMVATIAFGMGIDKSNVRFVAHLDLPKSIEAYYQETGRAGRDGLPANAWLIYGMQDVINLRYMLDASNAAVHQKRIERQKLDALLGLCAVIGCRRAALLRYFGDSAPAHCGNCDNCQNPPPTWDASLAAQQALSAIYRTGQKYGAAYIIKVLLGSDDAQTQARGHQSLQVFGIGKALGANKWRLLMQQLLTLNYIYAEQSQGGALRLHSSARAILSGETSFLMRDYIKPARRKTAKPSLAIAGDQQQLFDELRALRLQISQTEAVAPFMVFSDASLLDMVQKNPQTIAEFAKVNGVGTHKLKKYAVRFVALIKSNQASL